MRAPEWALIIVALITLSGTVLTYRVSRRRDTDMSAHQLLDQHQEDIASLREQVAALHRQQRIQADYILQLRMHIADSRPPPPPPWPPGLIT